MKAEQLRRGNIIAFNDGSTDIVKVDYLFRSEGMWFVEWIKVFGDGSFLNGNSILDDFDPIPLTPEILEACGFVQQEFITREFNKEGDYNFKAINHYENGFLIICNFMQGGIKLKYLHQLQNLFFPLTGEELQVNLKEKARV